MAICDLCAQPIDPYGGYVLFTPLIGTYRICDDCSLPLDRFTDRIERARERRVKTIQT